MSDAERDRQEAEFLLGNELLRRTLDRMEHAAIDQAMNAYAGDRRDVAEHAMREAGCIRELRARLEALLTEKATPRFKAV